MNLFDAMEISSTAQTANGAVTLPTSTSKIVDFFFLLGAMRNSPESEIIRAFSASLAEDFLITVRSLFYARDVRGGQGERNLFKVCMKYMANAPKYKHLVEKNLHLVPVYGRWDDMTCFIGTTMESKALSLWSEAILSGDGLACKWAPREASSKASVAKLLMQYTKLSPKSYRKHLSSNTKVVESSMCSGSWDTINYSHVPSVAMKNYRNAFKTHSPYEWELYMDSLNSGTAKINSSVLFPVDLVAATMKNYSQSLDHQWNSLPNYLSDAGGNNLVVVDVSGSMFTGGNPQAVEVAVSLGLYISERNTGIYKNKFITFSEKPKIETIYGANLSEKVSNLLKADWGGSTNIQKTFDLILNAAKNHNIPQSEMPNNIIIVSDMEFNFCDSGSTNYHLIKSKFEASGYKMPKIIFWNVNGRIGNVPASKNDYVNLVSGYSPSICKSVLKTSTPTPIDAVLDVVNSDRYSLVTV